jgi:hypothetical protein
MRGDQLLDPPFGHGDLDAQGGQHQSTRRHGACLQHGCIAVDRCAFLNRMNPFFNAVLPPAIVLVKEALQRTGVGPLGRLQTRPPLQKGSC